MQNTDLSFLKNLDQKGSVIAEYIWIDGTEGLRSKCRTLTHKINKVSDCPEWNYDGSSTNQAVTENSEIILKPVAFFPDPFRGGDNVMVLCEGFMWEDNTFQKLVPNNTNFRHFAKTIFDAGASEEPWYGIEQEYTLLSTDNKFHKQPLGWPQHGYPGNQGPYYCSVGGNVCFGREIADLHYKACLYAGIKISGTNAEVMPGQWEFQVGPCLGIEIGDHMFMARYLLGRVVESFNLAVNFEPKLFPDWNGSGCHTNFSTKTMREGTGGMKYIDDMMKHFEKNHKLHMKLYGVGNDKRLTGEHETSSSETFSYGPGNRAASFRIPTSTYAAKGKGYIEDRRPASNIDSYVVAAVILSTGCLNGKGTEDLVAHYDKWTNFLKKEGIELA